jgi:purine catabolism regulator
MRVREVLGASTLAGARVLAGAAGLDRMVRRLNVMEVPDILPWVKPHELLLTTGYPLRHDPGALVELVAELDARGLAAMAIKLNRYLDELPPPMLAEADRRGFPIIEFPDGVGFDDVLNEVLGELLNRQAAELARSEEVHRALVSVVLEGGDLDDLAVELARILGGPVMITTTEGSGTARAGGEVPAASTRTVVPIVAGRVEHGQIVAFSPVPLTDVDVHVLERAATVAALAITKRLAVAAVESKYRADFLRDVLTGRAGTPERISARARAFGWNLERPVTVLVAELDPDGDERSAQDRLVACWTAAMRRHDPRGAVAGFSHEVVAVLDATVDAARVAKDAASAFADTPPASFSTGTSRPVPGAEALPEAYGQALKAARVGRQLHGPGAVAHFDQLGVYRLLSLVNDTEELHAFVRETLGPLAADHDAENSDLRRTLQVLLETNLNVAETARRLHFHYNTLRYRIGKLERLLGNFTDDPHLRLNLTLALHVLRMRGI